MSKKDLYIRINGELINVSEEVYLTYYRMESRARYLERKDILHGKVLYSDLDTDETTGEEAIPDLDAESVEDAALKAVMLEKMQSSLKFLTTDEQQLIEELFFRNMSERQFSKEIGVPYMTIHDRKVKILDKLKKIMKK
ncbi:MAG: sigma-70 family RNA polymerase sigma factor [Clostridia bacterium]|nr:sigma-70 family RNA polymerase sigma factor [Clostridia bacterium]